MFHDGKLDLVSVGVELWWSAVVQVIQQEWATLGNVYRCNPLSYESAGLCSTLQSAGLCSTLQIQVERSAQITHASSRSSAPIFSTNACQHVVNMARKGAWFVGTW